METVERNGLQVIFYFTQSIKSTIFNSFVWKSGWICIKLLLHFTFAPFTCFKVTHQVTVKYSDIVAFFNTFSLNFHHYVHPAGMFPYTDKGRAGLFGHGAHTDIANLPLKTEFKNN